MCRGCGGRCFGDILCDICGEDIRNCECEVKEMSKEIEENKDKTICHPNGTKCNLCSGIFPDGDNLCSGEGHEIGREY